MQGWELVCNSQHGKFFLAVDLLPGSLVTTLAVKSEEKVFSIFATSVSRVPIVFFTESTFFLVFILLLMHLNKSCLLCLIDITPDGLPHCISAYSDNIPIFIPASTLCIFCLHLCFNRSSFFTQVLATFAQLLS